MLLRPVLRLAYRLAWAGISLRSRLLPARKHAAVVAVWGEAGLLVVRPSYRYEIDLPGGMRRRDEPAAAAAARELKEEVGIDVPVAALFHACDVTSPFHRCVFEVAVFEWRTPDPPAPRVDRVEILWAAYRDPASLIGERLGPSLALYLAWLKRQEAGPAPA